jgi:hypothetical protein
MERRERRHHTREFKLEVMLRTFHGQFRMGTMALGGPCHGTTGTREFKLEAVRRFFFGPISGSG